MDLHYIVDQLNAPPFQYNLSLLTIRLVCAACSMQQQILNLAFPKSFRSEKSSQELLQLVSDVFAKISPRHQVLRIIFIT